jgi:vacuolar-type H+-ATPase subunit H
VATDAELLMIEAEKLQRMSDALEKMRLLFESAEAECLALHQTIKDLHRHNAERELHELEHQPMPGP